MFLKIVLHDFWANAENKEEKEILKIVLHNFGANAELDCFTYFVNTSEGGFAPLQIIRNLPLKILLHVFGAN